MMKIVGLTGGIGSGKTTVANFFSAMGVPVYTADKAAKRLMRDETPLRAKIIDLLGPEAYQDGLLNRAWIADRVFPNKQLLAQLNALVHPVVARDFEAWCLRQKGNYVIKEVAILFETGGQKYCDLTILVTAPVAERIARVMQRDQLSRAQVEERLQHQWTDAKKEQLAHIVVVNRALKSTEIHVRKIKEILDNKIDKGMNIRFC